MSMFLLQLLKDQYLQVEESVKGRGFLVAMEQLREKLAQRVFMVHSARNALWEPTRMLLDHLDLYAFRAL
uniref:Uncharacterized protein n=1 Tax=Arundo donax TaxID=35708 RepID=A0A0A9CVA6_ARUDO